MKINISIPNNFTLILYEIGSSRSKKIERLETKSQRRFTRRLNQLPNRFDAYLRVHYSDNGWNDGDYYKKKDLFLAYNAFIEK